MGVDLSGVGGRFRSRYDERTLLDVVAQLAEAVCPATPAALTQRDYDAARATAGYADAPSGKQIAARLGMPWRELVELATHPTIDKDRELGRHLGRDDEEWLGPAAVKAALRTVALRLGLKTLGVADYCVERERILEEARRAVRHEGEPLLPTESQILRIAGSWDEALRIAGLERRQRDDHKGVSVVEALEWALESMGALPTRRELFAFAEANGFSVAWKKTAWPAALAELRRRRAEWGKWTPLEPPPLEARPDYTIKVPLPVVFAAHRRRRRRWSRAECLEALTRLLGELGSERLTQRVFQQKSRLDPDVPPLTAIQRHGSFGEMLTEARKARPRGRRR